MDTLRDRTTTVIVHAPDVKAPLSTPPLLLATPTTLPTRRTPSSGVYVQSSVVVTLETTGYYTQTNLQQPVAGSVDANLQAFAASEQRQEQRARHDLLRGSRNQKSKQHQQQMQRQMHHQQAAGKKKKPPPLYSLRQQHHRSTENGMEWKPRLSLNNSYNNRPTTRPQCVPRVHVKEGDAVVGSYRSSPPPSPRSMIPVNHTKRHGKRHLRVASTSDSGHYDSRRDVGR